LSRSLYEHNIGHSKIYPLKRPLGFKVFRRISNFNRSKTTGVKNQKNEVKEIFRRFDFETKDRVESRANIHGVI